MNIIVLGAGAWGTALAVSAADRHRVTLWARDAQQANALLAARENARYLPGISLPASLAIRAEPVEALGSLVAAQDLVILATPMAGLRGLLAGLRDCLVPVAWLCKGFEASVSGSSFGLLAHEIRAEVAPNLSAGVLSGPSFAQEVARGQPTALVAASEHAAVRDALVEAFHSPTLRVYANEDIVGVEVGGAVKNVLAIATGLCDGLNLGLNARAALITRGLAEMTRLGTALGANAETFMGLSGLGDLVLTATGDLSRNRKVGLLLAEGKTLQEAVDSLGHVAEGVYCARTVEQRAQGLGVEMPIAQAVVALLDGRLKPADAVAALMGRGPVAEQA
ncbi:MAG TPA: NAD(P)H-dependent glycerol-3-phosphate dehydrogenase [Burkholderiaceae bacterium]|nr:NAD(P)H-dependent glycerol-3-phosphate dehydrogenase [Burkholderiaceae bacterium]